jgi:MFS family permease
VAAAAAEVAEDTTRLTVPTGRASTGGDRAPRAAWRIVAALAISQTVGYGVLAYAFSVLLTPMQQSLHTGPATITGALTVSLLAAAAMAVPLGRWLDRHGGRALMTLGSVTATLLVVAWSQAHTVAQLYAVWIGIGVVSAAVLYEAAFAVVVTWFNARQRASALLAVTVVAGFASSIFLPLTGALVEAYGWRTALLVLAAVHGAITVPLHLLVRRPAGPTKTGRTSAGAPHAPPPDRRASVAGVLRDRGYWLLAAVFVTQAAAVSVVTVHLVAYLRDLGHRATFAATIAGLLGILSVTGRLATTGAQRRYHPTTVVAAVFVIQGAGALVLARFGSTTGGAVTGVLAFGIGFGVATIARPALLADRYGTTGYATIAGVLTVPLTIVKATAPLAASLVRAHTGSYTPVAGAVAAACLLAAAGLAILRRQPPPPDRPPQADPP